MATNVDNSNGKKFEKKKLLVPFEHIRMVRESRVLHDWNLKKEANVYVYAYVNQWVVHKIFRLNEGEKERERGKRKRKETFFCLLYSSRHHREQRKKSIIVHNAQWESLNEYWIYRDWFLVLFSRDHRRHLHTDKIKRFYPSSNIITS